MILAGVFLCLPKQGMCSHGAAAYQRWSAWFRLRGHTHTHTLSHTHTQLHFVFVSEMGSNSCKKIEADNKITSVKIDTTQNAVFMSSSYSVSCLSALKILHWSISSCCFSVDSHFYCLIIILHQSITDVINVSCYRRVFLLSDLDGAAGDVCFFRTSSIRDKWIVICFFFLRRSE